MRAEVKLWCVEIASKMVPTDVGSFKTVCTERNLKFLEVHLLPPVVAGHAGNY